MYKETEHLLEWELSPFNRKLDGAITADAISILRQEISFLEGILLKITKNISVESITADSDMQVVLLHLRLPGKLDTLFIYAHIKKDEVGLFADFLQTNGLYRFEQLTRLINNQMEIEYHWNHGSDKLKLLSIENEISAQTFNTELMQYPVQKMETIMRERIQRKIIRIEGFLSSIDLIRFTLKCKNCSLAKNKCKCIWPSLELHLKAHCVIQDETQSCVLIIKNHNFIRLFDLSATHIENITTYLNSQTTTTNELQILNISTEDNLKLLTQLGIKMLFLEQTVFKTVFGIPTGILNRESPYFVNGISMGTATVLPFMKTDSAQVSVIHIFMPVLSVVWVDSLV